MTASIPYTYRDIFTKKILHICKTGTFSQTGTFSNNFKIKVFHIKTSIPHAE